MEIAQGAKEQGADLIGFVFAESKRQIDIKKAHRIGQEVKGISKVGVFVNSPLQEVQEIAEYCQLDYVQLHGEETPEYCRSVGRPVIKAFRVAPGFNFERSQEYPADWILLDSFTPGQYGGTGITFDWQSLQDFTSQSHIPVMVAGGLTPENVGAAISLLSPSGIDVSGGVETNGKKDIKKIQEFMIAARRAEGGKTNAK
ncbi:phosphoribosylanthranilate isomerase [Pelosinus propionicus]|uniref:N-(5'-phosphoribosyl)anthranilate isomerase n=1 Tax=Pelosinus propionicus DSM 13327 TaxID=1123291 RepID=A0A1I4GMZ2_9FIRM|nr:phosphoribosylanthranilate isomerase [Pelosinus propionicus]SFL30757.1 phosphoribosylanthranilate isomerase [Pelosinus propionicus DSM 13327]